MNCLLNTPPIGVFIFKEVDGYWTCINAPFGLLSDFLWKYSILIDEDCQFCRIIENYGADKLIVEYRNYFGNKIRINISKITDEAFRYRSFL